VKVKEHESGSVEGTEDIYKNAARVTLGLGAAFQINLSLKGGSQSQTRSDAGAIFWPESREG